MNGRTSFVSFSLPFEFSYLISVRFHPSFSFFLFLISCCTTVQEILILRIVNTWTLNSFSGKYFYKNEDNKSWKNISVAGALTYRTRWFQVLLLLSVFFLLLVFLTFMEFGELDDRLLTFLTGSHYSLKSRSSRALQSLFRCLPNA